MQRLVRSVLNAPLTLAWWLLPVSVLVAYDSILLGAPNALSASHIPVNGVAPQATVLLFAVGCIGAAMFSVLRRRVVDQGATTRKDVLEQLRELSEQDFTDRVSAAFVQHGFHVADTRGIALESHVDLVIERGGAMYYVLCRRWRSLHVGARVMCDLLRVVHRHNVAGGIVLTTGHFAPDAREFAARTSVKLLDGPALEQLLRGELPESAIAGPACPRCRTSMVKRVAERGEHAGNAYWACRKAPSCRGVRSLEAAAAH
jgi:restriction system protein